MNYASLILLPWLRQIANNIGILFQPLVSEIQRAQIHQGGATSGRDEIIRWEIIGHSRRCVRRLRNGHGGGLYVVEGSHFEEFQYNGPGNIVCTT